MNIVSICGSPSPDSRSSHLLHMAQMRLEGLGQESNTIAVRELPARALLVADLETARLRTAVEQVRGAEIVLVSSPVHAGAYSGLLKLFLDLLPRGALNGKTVLPLAAGASRAHALALDYALKPVLSALGAVDILDGVMATDEQLVPAYSYGGYVASEALVEKLDAALRPAIDLRASRRPVWPAPAWADAARCL